MGQFVKVTGKGKSWRVWNWNLLSKSLPECREETLLGGGGGGAEPGGSGFDAAAARLGGGGGGWLGGGTVGRLGGGGGRSEGGRAITRAILAPVARPTVYGLTGGAPGELLWCEGGSVRLGSRLSSAE